MKSADYAAEVRRFPKEATLFAAGQRLGSRNTQEDAVANFSDECFALADGVGGLPHGEVASQLAVQTAVWAYEHIRQRRFYWQDKKLLLKRIFRTVGLALVHKRKEHAYNDGLATTLTVAVVGPHTVWIGSIGDSAAYLYRAEVCVKLTDDDIDQFGYLTKALGVSSPSLVPQIVTERFIPGDVLLLASDGITAFVTEWKLKSLVETIGDTQEDLGKGIDVLCDTGQSAGSRDNMTAMFVKRVKRE